MFGLDQGSVSRFIGDVTEALSKKTNEFRYFSSTHEVYQNFSMYILNFFRNWIKQSENCMSYIISRTSLGLLIALIFA